jgi:hypothetical protein
MMTSFLVGMIIAIIYCQYRDKCNLQKQIDDLSDKFYIYDDKLKTLFYHIKDNKKE